MTSFLVAGLLLGHLLRVPGQVGEVGWFQYWTHTVYALAEPWVLRTADFMTTNWFFARTRVGRALVWLVARTNPHFPHGVVIPTAAAIHLVREIEKSSGEKAHVAVGPCVCQRSLNRFQEPVNKDVTIWYGAEIYERRFRKEYRMITAEEAAGLFRECHDRGLAPVVEFCMQSSRWMFVICNCDREICAPTRIYNLTGLTVRPGPWIALQDDERCLGVKACGACLDRCNFKANRVDGDRVKLDPAKCLGCGLCVTTCKGKARRLTPRPGYQGRLLPWEYVKDAPVL